MFYSARPFAGNCCYIFTSLPNAYRPIFTQHVEQLFEALSQYMAFDETDELWHNKCSVYLFTDRPAFETFADKIVKYPKGKKSGGFFHRHGREALIADFLDSRYGGKTEQLRGALLAVAHDGTEAYIQLAGYDEILPSWLRNGMNQFVSFSLDNARYPTPCYWQKKLLPLLKQKISQKRILTWAEGSTRPKDYEDHEGYAFAWSRVIYLHSILREKKKLTEMIKLMKLGSKGKEAMDQAYGKTTEELERVYRSWLPNAVKRGLRP